jgi:hypothetical protein
MKMIISFVLVSALPLALAAPAFAERGHGGEFHDEFRGGHEGSEREHFHHFGGYFLIANWTNNWEAVPEKYRSQAKRPCSLLNRRD